LEILENFIGAEKVAKKTIRTSISQFVMLFIYFWLIVLWLILAIQCSEALDAVLSRIIFFNQLEPVASFVS